MMSKGIFAATLPFQPGQKLYSYIFSLLDDVFRLHFSNDANDGNSALCSLLLQVKSKLLEINEFELLSGTALLFINRDDDAHFDETKQHRDSSILAEHHIQDISDLISQIENEHFDMTNTLRVKIDTLIPVLKLLFGRNWAV
ncbi:MAG: hypothetical protein V4561_00575 [Bacteroidota bacterium]